MAVKKDPEFHRKESIFATQSVATVAAAVERDVALSALAEQIRARVRTPRSEFVDQNRAFASSRAAIEDAWASGAATGGDSLS